MKKMLGMVLILAIFITFSACESNANVKDKADEDDNVKNHLSDMRIKLIFGDKELIVNMYDNPTSREFLDQLPLKVTLQDFANTEKISVLNKKLTTKNAPSGSNPSIGDLAYFSPWGNIALFYEDHDFSNGLIKLGKIESGVGQLKSINGDFEVTIEKLNTGS
ncbi:cyclophilin-like fold protein [Bacillus thuringiensis]|uniref:cyclophilin-like fold protein n=1 Tax=Bacillus thuringiensis TaxID=1428 RepID=UPI00234EC8DD|nr:cyclophilin-like fold protein [Bacillus thuringiensis]MDC7735394.1 cyclophilin-like fold protein [Bacillus thuringiensis]HDR8196692.1 hypothetical protein [Bacillus thuringiensis]